MRRPRVRGLARAVARRLQGGEHLGAAVRIALRHRGAALAYARYAPEIAAGGGPDAARWYAALIVATADADGELAVDVARTVPEHLSRIAPEHRSRFGALLHDVLRARPGAVPLVARTAPALFEAMAPDAIAAFVGRALELYAASPASAESFLLRESERGRRQARELVPGIGLDEVHRVLTLYARAHCGEDVDIRPLQGAVRGFPDGRVLHLPARVDDYGDERDFLVYRVMTAQCAAYLEFGTFDVPGDAALSPAARLDAALRRFPRFTLARDLFQVLEDRRVEVRLRDAYPGVARDLDRLRAAPARPRPPIARMSPADQLVEVLLRDAWGLPADGADPRVLDAAARLRPAIDAATSRTAAVSDVFAVLPAVYAAAAGFLATAPPGRPPEPEGGENRTPPEADDAEPPPIDASRGEGSGQGSELPSPGGGGDDDYRGLEPSTAASSVLPDDAGAFAERLSEELARIAASMDAALPDEARAARAGVADAEYAQMEAWLDKRTSPSGALVTPSRDEGARDAASVTGGPLEATSAATLYPEWDATIADWKPDWVRVVEHRVDPDSPAFADRVRDRYGPLVRRLRRTFEAMRPEVHGRVRGVVDGDEIDIDAAVEAHTVRRAGGSPSERLYSRRDPVVRDVVVAFLVDLSSSTNEVVGMDGKRIIEIEKEALVVISEALDALGDRFAIHGFSGYGRDHVAYYVAKDFDEPLTDTVRARVGAMRWKMENRDGAAIRHCTQRLLREPARQRLLFLLSDGRPLDCGCDQYFDKYAQQDTRMALMEARRQRIHPFCLTVDPRGEDYLEAMYGKGGYTIVDRVEALPVRLPALYRRLVR